MKPTEIIRRRHPGDVQFVALDRQHGPVEPGLRGAFVSLLGAGGVSLGAEVEKFEAEFAAYCEVSRCVAVASGTAALAMMLSAYGIGPGDEVILPAHTHMVSPLAIDQVGATPVLCDVEDGSGLIDPDSARAALSPRTAAVLAVHLYGQVCNMAAIEAFAKPAGLLVLEDAAQATGARYCGHRAGSLGAAAAFSFHPTSNLGALGDGGAICTDDDLLAARLRRLRTLGRRNDGLDTERGYGERLDERQAVRLARRDAVAAGLRARGIETRIHYSPPVHAQPAWWDRSRVHGALPHTEAWASEELSLPMHPHLRTREIERVTEAVRAAARSSVPY